MPGEGCELYADKNCTSELKIIDVNVGQATTAYIKVTRGNISKVYTLYVMGVKDLADIEYAKVSPQTVGGHRKSCRLLSDPLRRAGRHHALHIL